MAKRRYTKTWWGEKWLDALKGALHENRIGRGQTYANTGRVYDIRINGNFVSARVKGNYQSHYNVRIIFEEYSDEEKSTIKEIISQNPSILSALLNHKLPEELYYKLVENHVKVFPTNIDDMNPSCNCPDWAYICKHIAGLIYMLAYEIDKDPFLVFKLQGFDLLKSLHLEEQTEVQVRDISDLFSDDSYASANILSSQTNEKENKTNHKPNEKEINPKINEMESNTNPHQIDSTLLYHNNIDFSKIPDLIEPIFFLLNETPSFYQKNFKEVLNNSYKSMAKYMKKAVENYRRFYGEYYNPYYELNYTGGHFKGDEEEYPQWLENVFNKRWDYPLSWERFNLNLNKKYEISKINIEKDTLFKTDKSKEALFAFFTELSESNIERFNENIQFANLIFEFTMELVEKHAIIPELFKNGKYYQIRWIPAVFDREISKLINQLSIICPENLLKFNNRKISQRNQIISLVSIFIQGFINRYLLFGSTKKLQKEYNEAIFRLFFFEKQKLSDTTAESINQWLSKFTINARDYDLYLVIDENEVFNNEDGEIETSFSIDIKVNDEMESINSLIETSENNELKMNLLKDIHIIEEIFPRFNQLINLKEEINYDLNDFSDFFINTLPLFEIMGIKIIMPKTLQKIFKPVLRLDISSTKNEDSYIRFEDLTRFDWKVAIGESDCSIDEFKEIALKSRGLVKLNNNYVMLNESEIKSLIKQIDKLPEKLNKHEMMKALLSGKIEYAEVNMDLELKDLFKNIGKSEDITIPENVLADLRDYQKTGFRWLVQNIQSDFGSILADDMGLGKTLEVLTTIQHLKNQGLLEKEKVLIVAPTSLLTNWAEEIRKFTPDLSSFIYHGQGRRFPKRQYDIYLTSYGHARTDINKIKSKKWFLTVIDEAQNIKNPNTKQTKAIKSIKSKHRIAMSGTPVENRLAEYWSIFDFINKGYLKGLKNFRTNYIIPIEKEKNLDVLDNFRLITEPFILRRLKSDKSIIKELPDKIVNDVYCNLSKEQIGLYKETLDLSIKNIEELDGMERKGIVLKLINSLKQICNHPAQFTKSNKYAIGQSGKLELLVNTLENILDNNEKVLIFTQYVEMGNIIKDLVEEKFGTEVLFLHGSLNRKKRDQMVKRFQNGKQNKVFIVSLKAGGTGLNLTAASNVIHYDLWWNPAVENQATDRAYRIGQKDNVMVYRFITSGTFEEKINEMIHKKEELANLTVGTGESFITEMGNEELVNILELRK